MSMITFIKKVIGTIAQYGTNANEYSSQMYSGSSETYIGKTQIIISCSV